MRSTGRTRQHAPWIELAATAALVLAVGGCGRSDAPTQAINEAGRKVRVVSAREKNPAPYVKKSVAAYADTINTLKPAIADGNVGQSAAASLLTARSQASQAGFLAEAAAAAEREALAGEAKIRASFDTWLSCQARAAALEHFDPATQVNDLESQIKKRVEEGARAKAEKQKLDEALATLENTAKEQLEKSRAERDEETKLRQQAVSASATERAELITRANQHRRTSDGFDKSASLLRAQAAARAPEARDLQAEIDRLNAQSKLLADSKAELVALAKSNADKATQAKADAMAAAQAIKDAVAELGKLRQTIPDLTDKTTKTFGQAVAAAKSAQKPETDQETKAAAKLAMASYKHSTADVLATRAGGLDDFADTMTLISTGNFPLPEAQSYKSLADEAAKQRDEAIEAAKKAYADAATDYDGVAGRPEVKERLKRVSDSLKKLGERNVEVPAWLAPAPTPISTLAVETAPSSGGGAASAPAGSEGEVRKAVEALIAAAKAQDAGRFLSLLHPKTPEDEKFLSTAVKLTGGMAKLDDACKQKFGSTFTEIAKQSGSGMAAQMGGMNELGALGLPNLGELSADDLAITVVDAATATVGEKGGGETFTMKRAGAAWKLETAFPAMVRSSLGDNSPIVDSLGGLFDEFTGEVKAGKFATGADLMAEFQKRMMAAMMKGMGGGPGGGGRPPKPKPGG